MDLLDTNTKNNVLASMMKFIDQNRKEILEANQQDLDAFNKEDKALYDRLVVNDKKIDDMIRAVEVT